MHVQCPLDIIAVNFNIITVTTFFFFFLNSYVLL